MKSVSFAPVSFVSACLTTLVMCQFVSSAMPVVVTVEDFVQGCGETRASLGSAVGSGAWLASAGRWLPPSSALSEDSVFDQILTSDEKRVRTTATCTDIYVYTHDPHVWNLQDMFRDARAEPYSTRKTKRWNTGAVPALAKGFTFVLVVGDQNHTTSAIACRQKSMHSCQPEVRALDGVNDARRGAALACRLSGADQR